MEIKAIQKEENVIWEGVQEWEGKRKAEKWKISVSAEDSCKNRITILKNSSYKRHQITRHTILSSTQSNNQPPHRSHTLNPLRHN